MKEIIFVGILTIMITFGIVHAVPQISISTDKSTYNGGQSLSFTIRVSEVAGDRQLLR